MNVSPWTASSTSCRGRHAAHPPELRAISIAGAGCGLRQGEVFGLAVEDVDFLRHTVHARLQVKAPDGELRTSSLIFPHRDGEAMTREYYAHNGWKPALAAADVERKRPVLLQQGVSIRAVAEHLGHHDPGFTLRTYAHLMPDDQDRSRAAIDAVHGSLAGSVRTGEVS